MTTTEERAWIRTEARQVYENAGFRWPPLVSGPIPLGRLIAESGLVHDEVAGLNYAVASVYLQQQGLGRLEVPTNAPDLAGLLFANVVGGYILVRRDDILARRRFTAAHELGHYRLHLGANRNTTTSDGAVIVLGDTADTIQDEGDGDGDDPLKEVERQANQFAAELLMPEEVCRRLCELHSRRSRPTPQFLVQRLASELLVSPTAMRCRLTSLKLLSAD